MFIVLLNGPKGIPMLLIDGDDNPMMFPNEWEAQDHAERNSLGRERGFQIVEWEYHEGYIA